MNALLVIVSTPSSAPVIVATRLRKGSASPTRGAARLVADAIKTSRTAGAGERIVLRADSAHYGSEVIAAARRHDALSGLPPGAETRKCRSERGNGGIPTLGGIPA